MKRVLAVLMLVLGSVSAHAQDAKSCRLTRYAAIPFTTVPDGRITIPVTVDGQSADFMIDTGGVSASMTPELAKKIGRTPKMVNRWLIGVGSTLMATAVHVDEFGIGALKGGGFAVYVDPRLGEGVDGTVDPDMMTKFDVDFDFARGTMSLFSQDHCPGNVVYWAKQFVVLPMDVRLNSGHIQVPVTINGKTVRAMLDTGAMDTVMSLKLAKSVGIAEDDPALKVKRSWGQGGRYKIYNYPFKMLDMDGIAVTNPHITIMSDNLLEGLDDHIILGMGILRQLHLYVAYKEEKLYITPAE